MLETKRHGDVKYLAKTSRLKENGLLSYRTYIKILTKLDTIIEQKNKKPKQN